MPNDAALKTQRLNLFELPIQLLDGLEPYKVQNESDSSSESESESESESDRSSESESESDSEFDGHKRLKPSSKLFSSVVTNYNSSDDEESMEEWQWTHRAHITGTPFVYFSSTKEIPAGKVLSVYKAWFEHQALVSHPVESLRNLPRDGQSCVLMVGSGHFAGAIISHRNHKHRAQLSNPCVNVNVLKSKTFHRYTTRRKQGGAQSASDAARGKANSAGSTIRRANERMLMDEIKELLASWEQDLKNCTRIFFRAPGRSNKQLLAGYPNAPIAANDPRLARIPFATGRPTLNECKSAWLQLTQARFVDPPQPTVSAKNTKNDKPTKTKQDKAAKNQDEAKETQPEPTADELATAKIIDLIKRSKLPGIKALVEAEMGGNFDFRLQPRNKFLAFPTPLLYAAHNNKPNVVSQLLKWGANPLVKNENGQTLGEIAQPHQRTREALQIARHELGEKAFDWKRAKIDKPISRDELMAREAAQKLEIEKKNAEMDAENDRLERERKMEKLIKMHGSGRKLAGGAFTASQGLSAEDLRQVERERRARAAEARLKRMQS